MPGCIATSPVLPLLDLPARSIPASTRRPCGAPTRRTNRRQALTRDHRATEGGTGAMPTLAWACSSTAMDRQIVADIWRQRPAIQGDRVVLSSHPGPIACTPPLQTCPRKRACHPAERRRSPVPSLSRDPVHWLVMAEVVRTSGCPSSPYVSLLMMFVNLLAPTGRQSAYPFVSPA